MESNSKLFFKISLTYILIIIKIINFFKNFVLDVFFLVTMFSCSVAAAVRESQLNNTKDQNLRNITNRGAFGSAAVRFLFY